MPLKTKKMVVAQLEQPLSVRASTSSDFLLIVTDDLLQKLQIYENFALLLKIKRKLRFNYYKSYHFYFFWNIW